MAGPRMAPYLLPYLAGRPVNLHRFPDGVDRPGFWQKEVPDHAPDWVRRWHHVEAAPGETRWYAVLDHPAALVWAANYGAIELYPWTSRLPEIREPTWALIDIDPVPRTGFDDVLVLARLYRAALEHLQVRAAPKVTGQRGLQIWVPIEPGYSFVLGMAHRPATRPGPTRLHPERDQHPTTSPPRVTRSPSWSASRNHSRPCERRGRQAGRCHLPDLSAVTWRRAGRTPARRSGRLTPHRVRQRCGAADGATQAWRAHPGGVMRADRFPAGGPAGDRSWRLCRSFGRSGRPGLTGSRPRRR